MDVSRRIPEGCQQTADAFEPAVERRDDSGDDGDFTSTRILLRCQPPGVVMPSTYLRLNYHIVFSTKNRAAFIADEWASRLHEYLGRTINGLDGVTQGVGGVADHVHLLVGLKATHTLSDVLRELKKASSGWVHQQVGCNDFAWQEGYAAFTVSPSARPSVQRYITKQREHHRRRTFRDELIELLKRAGIEYDPQYLD